MASTEKLYKYHCENLRQVSNGMEHVARLMRHSIGSDDTPTVKSLLRLYALLLGAWAECRLKKVLYEPQFDTGARQTVRQGPQHDRWSKCVEIGFRRRYSVQSAALSASTLPFTAFARYSALQALIEYRIKPVIELRNRLAHGQWSYLLTNEEEDVSNPLMAAISQLNLMTLQFTRDLLEHTSAIVNDLMVSAATFERDFDRHYKLIENTKLNLCNRSYTDYEAQLKRKLLNGKKKQARERLKKSPMAVK